jgi:hypothetical protein
MIFTATAESRKIYSKRKGWEAGSVRCLKRGICSSRGSIPWFGWMFTHYKGWARRGNLGGA